jgi:phenazine biosynthesis protein phzE
MFKEHSIVQQALNNRNKFIAKFWLTEPQERFQLESVFVGRKIIMIDAEDSFTEMFAQQLTAIGLEVTIRKFNTLDLIDHHWDLVIMGPGPGDPQNTSDPRIASMNKIMISLIAKQIPFLAVCLSHQILCLQLGLKLIRKIPPNQGMQREINYFGQRELVGFYNTYAAQCSKNQAEYLNKDRIKVSRDIESSEVYALKGPYFASMQFHAESLLTCNGIDIIASTIKDILNL